MEYEEFRKILKELNISMKEFSKLINTNYGTVKNWGNKGRAVPAWVESWLSIYIQNKDLREISITKEEYREYKELLQLKELIGNIARE
jgi:DNA-binding transcriptional regulator YiaG